MLQSIRDKTHGWIAGIIISLLILSFGLWGIHSYLTGATSSTTVAKVDGVDITKGQLAVAFERLRRQPQSQEGGLTEQAESTLKSRALQILINIQILKQASLDEDYRISLQQAEGLLESMPDFQVNNVFSMALFQQKLSSTLFTPADFIDLLQTSLLIDQPRLGLLLTSFALPDEITTAITLVNQERDIQYAELLTQTFAKQPITVPQDQIEAYYKAHQDEFKTPEQVSVDYIELSVDALMKTMHPSADELKNFYNENSSSFAEPMQWKIDVILVPLSDNASPKEVNDVGKKVTDMMQQIKAGKDFSTFAAQYPSRTKLQGWVMINQVPQDMQKVLMSLSKPGQVSQPVRTRIGIVIVKANDIKQAKIQPYEAVQEKVKDALARQQAQEKFADMKDKLANVTYEHPESLQQAAQLLNLPIQSTGLFTKEKGSDDLSSHLKIRDAAFSPDVINSQNNSDVLPMSSDRALVLRIKSHVPATLLALQTVQKQIEDKLKTSVAEDLAAKQAAEIQAKLNSGTSLEAVAQQYHLTWNKVGYLGRHATKVGSAILDQAFAMPRPDATHPTVYSTVKTPSGYAIVVLNGVRDGVVGNDQNQYDLFGEQMQNAQGTMEYELYKQSVTAKAKVVVVNPQSGTDSPITTN